MLKNLGFKKRTHVGISLSANNFIELICIDNSTKSVVKYSSGNIKYNNAIREIIDFDEFAEVIQDLFEDAGLEPSECSVTLNLPNVHFGITTLESVSETPYIVENLQAEIEDLYIFKRNEPIISYSILDGASSRSQKNIVYSAVQTKVIVKLIEIFDSMEADLVRIDNSYSCMLKAIQYCDRFSKYVQKEEKTSILLITPNSCCSFFLHGNVLVDSMEEPLAVKSFSSEEVYSTITKIASNSISKNKPRSLLIISETDEVNSELLAQRLNFEGDLDCINKSINANEQFIEVSGIGSDIDANMISYMTIEAVGAAASDYDDYPLNINFMPAERINENLVQVGDYEVDLYRFIIVVILTALLSAVLLGAIISGVLRSMTDKIEGDTSAAQNKIDVFKKRVDENSKTQNKNVFPVLTQVLDNNKIVVDIYRALSTQIPESIYIRKYMSNANGGIGIVGEAKSSESVQEFVKSLREINPDLMLYKLSINSEDDNVPAKIKNGFTFEIKTSKSEINLDEDEQFIQSNIRNTSSKINGPSGGGYGLTPPPSPLI